ncbi:MAG: hypothetical protein PVSMB7_28400 [Chloroflexota bacterium]
MVYRDTEGAEERLRTLEDLVGAALSARSTRDMAQHAAEAQSETVGLEHYLQDGLDAAGYAKVEHRTDIERAINALSVAAVNAEAVALGTDLPSMRARVETFKRDVDAAVTLVRKVLAEI